MVSPQKIKYNGVDINEFLNPLTVILDVAFDSDNGEVSTFLNRSAVVSESHDGRYKNTHRYKYDEVFSPKFTIIKKDFSDFTQSELRQVLKYFTQTDKPALLEVSYDKVGEQVTEDKDFCAIGGFTSIEMYKISNSRTVGILATFEAITPYAMSNLKSITITSTDNYKKTIPIDTDDNNPVYPKITIQEKDLVVNLPTNVSFNNINDMAGYVENTIYHNESDGYYYYKAFTPTFMQGPTLPEYVNWTTVEANRKYTNADIFAANTFYHYEYEDMYYWKKDGVFYEEPTRPVYGDWKTKDGTKVYTASDTFEEKTIYSYNNNYYWMAPYSFYKSNTLPSLTTTSVKIINQHYNFFNQPSTPVTMVVKNNTSTEKIVIDGANRIPWSTNTRRIFGSDFDWNWLPLYDGKNELTVEGNCTVTLEWREVRKVGEY